MIICLSDYQTEIGRLSNTPTTIYITYIYKGFLLHNGGKNGIILCLTNKFFIPNLSNGVDVTDTPSGKHSKDKDPYGMDKLKRLHKKSHKEMKEKFKKINTKSTAPEKRIKGSFSLLQMQSDLKDIFIPVLKEIYRTTVKRFRRIFFNVNTHHTLISKISSK